MRALRVKTRRLVPALASVTLVIPIAGSPAQADQNLTPSTSHTDFYTQSPDWARCGPAWCAKVTVPLDYAKPDGKTISLSLRRVGSADLPPLVVNPGGPGSAGADFAQSIASALSPAVLSAFTIVGFDPRGTGDSAPVQCFTGKAANNWLRLDGTPDTPQEVSRYMARAATISPSCQRMSPRVAPNIGTENTVKDMDIIRSALRSKKLNWLGFSYGTLLGTRYAELFPNNVGAMVLDGAVDPALDAMELSRGQSSGFQKAVYRFDRKYPGSIKYMNSLLSSLDVRKMKTDSAQKLTQSEARNAIFLSMYNTSFWPELHGALKQAETGDGTQLQGLSYLANDQTSPTSFSSNVLSAFTAISCWDHPQTPSSQGLARNAKKFAKNARVPELARAMSWGNAPCSTWFNHSSISPAPADTTTSAPILIIGTTFDPATPLKWANSLHRQLQTSSLLTFDGDGHTAYLSGSDCVDTAVDQFLLSGVAPKTQRC